MIQLKLRETAEMAFKITEKQVWIAEKYVARVVMVHDSDVEKK